MKLQTLFESILQESFSDLYQILDNMFGEPDATEMTDLIKRARDRNLLPPEYKDIGQIIRLAKNSSFEFFDLLRYLEEEIQRRDEMKQRKKDDVFHYRSEDLVIVEPGSHESSCRYGSGTKWCTTMKNVPDHFMDYTTLGARLIYLLTDMNKFAIWISAGGDLKFYDDRNHPIREGTVRTSMIDQYEEYELEEMLNSIQDPVVYNIMRTILG